MPQTVPNSPTNGEIAPMVASSIGTAPDPLAALLAPRPFAPNENILQYQNAGHLAGNLVSMSLDQHSYKRFDLHFSYRHVNFKSDGGDALGSPQSSYSNQGESSRADWMRSNAGSFFGSVYLPYKIQLSAQLDGRTGAAYNITTGTDSNGDGIFNDRPAYASTAGAGKYQKPYGLLTANTVNGNLPRNALRGLGSAQWDFAVHREFVIHESLKLQFRAELFNALNHPNFGPPNGDLSGFGGSAFGQSSSMLGKSLNGGTTGSGGFNPLYQLGGPRSIQLGLKLAF